jgi:hypothetical protein
MEFNSPLMMCILNAGGFYRNKINRIANTDNEAFALKSSKVKYQLTVNRTAINWIDKIRAVSKCTTEKSEK